MQQAIVDRFEGTTAVLLIEDKLFDVPRSKLPHGIHEGDYLQVELRDGEITTLQHNEAAAEAAKKRKEGGA